MADEIDTEAVRARYNTWQRSNIDLAYTTAARSADDVPALLAALEEARRERDAEARAHEAHEKRVEAIVEQVVAVCQARVASGCTYVRIADIFAAIARSHSTQPTVSSDAPAGATSVDGGTSG